MKRYLGPTLAGAVALLLVAAFTLGYHIADSRAALRTVGTAAATPTTAAHEIPGVPCTELPNGTLEPFAHGALGNATQLACTVTVVGPDYLNEWRAKAPDGKTAEFRVASP